MPNVLLESKTELPPSLLISEKKYIQVSLIKAW